MITTFVTAPPSAALPPMSAFVVVLGSDLVVAGMTLLSALAAACVATRMREWKRSRAAKLRVVMGTRRLRVHHAA